MRKTEQPILAWLRLMRVHQKVGRTAAAHLREWDLSPAQFDILNQLSRNEGITQQELADRLLVTKGNICQLLGRLESRRLLMREPAGRSNRLYLTPRGRELLAEARPSHEALIAEQLEALSKEEQVQLLSLLGKVDRALE